MNSDAQWSGPRTPETATDNRRTSTRPGQALSLYRSFRARVFPQRSTGNAPGPVRYCLQILLLVGEGFRRHQCNWLASSLTFFTLLAIVPVLMLVFSLSTNFKDQIQPWIEAQVEGSPALIEAIRQIFDAASRTDVTALGGLGVLLLLFLVLKNIGTIEQSFNRIWEVKRSRNWLRKSTDYLSFLIIGPLFLFSIAGATRFQYAAANSIDFTIPWTDVTVRGTQIVGLGLVWLAFFFAYIALPNTRVRVFPALIAGVLAGTAWELAIKGYIMLQVGVGQSAAIYGAFAAIPIFLVWVQVSWLIVLTGAELGAAVQNRERYVDAMIAGNVPPRARLGLALHMLAYTADRFDRGQPPPTLEHCRCHFTASKQLLREIVESLVSHGILRSSAERDPWIVLGERPDRIAVADIVRAFDTRGTNAAWNMSGERAVTPEVRDILDTLEHAEQQSVSELTLATLARSIHGERSEPREDAATEPSAPRIAHERPAEEADGSWVTQEKNRDKGNGSGENREDRT